MISKHTNLTILFTDNFTDVKINDVAAYVLKHHKEKELIALALHSDKQLSSRANWAVWHCANIEYNRMVPFHDHLILNLKNKNLHDGVVRNTLRLFQNYPTPKKHHTLLLSICFNYLTNPIVAIAIRVFSMTIIFNISKPYPELLHELKICLMHVIETENSFGILSRAKKVLNQINKIS